MHHYFPPIFYFTFSEQSSRLTINNNREIKIIDSSYFFLTDFYLIDSINSVTKFILKLGPFRKFRLSCTRLSAQTPVNNGE